jgi:hypothetical protein
MDGEHRKIKVEFLKYLIPFPGGPTVLKESWHFILHIHWLNRVEE